jgi:tRNA pseudouridine38/39 synthase
VQGKLKKQKLLPAEGATSPQGSSGGEAKTETTQGTRGKEASKPPTRLTKRERKKQGVVRAFNWDAVNYRHIALHVAYLGHEYHGLAVQEHVCSTVEQHLFEALVKTRTIQSRETSNYTRSGRTDKGVSALGQIIALKVRSKLPEEGGNDNDEIQYAVVLNRCLPHDIRVLGWSPTSGVDTFSARFSARSRTYKYFFVRRNKDLARMERAGQHFIGSHDCRNFCKMDVVNVTNFVRVMDHIKVYALTGAGTPVTSLDMCVIEVKGQAFLWHQVRSMVSILFMVGSGCEEEDVIKNLLDIEKHPSKPQYRMAGEEPLLLYNSEFSNLAIRYEPEVRSVLPAVW